MMKKTLFYAILIAFNYLALEAISYTVYRIKYGAYDTQELQTSKLEASQAREKGTVYTTEDDAGKKVKRKNVLHPYLGYVVDGKVKTDGCEGPVEKCYSRIKVFTDKQFPKRSKETLIVGITGGSFAGGTASASEKQYISGLKKIPQYKDKEIIIVRLATGGYKQPQQLMQLNYVYALGAEFDMIINVDGFNEIAIPNTAYRNNSTHPSFPQSWKSHMRSTLSAELLTAYTEKQSLLKQQESIANFALSKGVNISPLFNLVWRVRNNNLVNKLGETDNAIQASGKVTNPDFNYQKIGPDFDFTTWPDFYRYTANIWAESSMLMNTIANSKGTLYFHFLQPNQHIEGNKILSDEELKTAYSPKRGYGGVYKKGHPYLVEQFDRLTENGVKFHDLTYYFKDTSATLYIDNCCHMSGKGYDLTVAQITQLIAENLKTTTSN